jgi:hypothetical protein
MTASSAAIPAAREREPVAAVVRWLRAMLHRQDLCWAWPRTAPAYRHQLADRFVREHPASLDVRDEIGDELVDLADQPDLAVERLAHYYAATNAAPWYDFREWLIDGAAAAWSGLDGFELVPGSSERLAFVHASGHGRSCILAVSLMSEPSRPQVGMAWLFAGPADAATRLGVGGLVSAHSPAST